MIEIPDEYGNLNEYVTDTGSYDSIQLNTCSSRKHCNGDKDCLSK